MTNLSLTIGDKNLSSWSLRPWLLMKQSGIPFTEQTIRLDRPETRGELDSRSPSGLVPLLRHGDTTVWDSLAISEYLAERHPEKKLWPEDAKARAEARSVSAEMHSGFASLRSAWPMNFSREGMRHLRPGGVQKDIDRIAAIWTGARKEYGGEGPFLFGRFSVADAMYAPVVSRFVTYGPVELPREASEWRDMMWALPAMREWGEGAAKEVGNRE